MAQLNDFSGGLNLRKAPHVINSNESVICSNVDTASLNLKPLKAPTDEVQDVFEFNINFLGTWVSSSSYKTYQEFQQKLYYSDKNGKAQKSSDGVTWYNLGIEKPTVKPTHSLVSSGNLTGTYQYCYTFYNSSDGTESQPSEFSDELEATAEKITISGKGSSDLQVDKVRVYRLGGNLTTMSLVVEVDNPGNVNGSYTDNISDIDILGNVLDSYQNGVPPTGISYLTEHNAMFFAAKDDKLYYSDIAYVNNWSAFNFIDFDFEITGLGSVPNGLLVFTKYKTYIVTGTSPTTLSKYLLSGNQGCLEHRTISFSDNTLLWLSSDGVCASNGGSIQVISRDKLVKPTYTIIKDSVVYDDVYYLSVDDFILCIDMRFGKIIRTIDISTDGFEVYNDILYYSKDGKLYSLFTNDNDLELEYKSPKLADGQLSNLKNYKTLYISCEGLLEFKVYIDDLLVATKNIDSSTREVLIPQLRRQGYSIQFYAKGQGTIDEIQYIVEGRQNGR